MRVPLVLAVNTPDFPNCIAPQGAVIANHPDGTHGIVGSTDTFTGSDAVYQFSSQTLTQCFCSDNGTGIQTNWWNGSSLTQEQINTLKSQGWFYVPNGNVWGLSDDPYMAQNSSYNCKSGPTNTTTGSNQGDGKSDGKSDGRSSCPQCTASPQILAVESGDVLGLASTGDIGLVYAVFGLAFVIFGIGSRMLRQKPHAK
jgi:hypothetical protein